jgi:alpha-tubulin suppressor-like RCC1 family protein
MIKEPIFRRRRYLLPDTRRNSLLYLTAAVFLAFGASGCFGFQKPSSSTAAGNAVFTTDTDSPAFDFTGATVTAQTASATPQWTGEPTLTQTPISNDRAAVIDLGSDHSCAVTEAGQIKCWGGNLHGQLGVHKGSSVPVLVRDGFIDVAAGGHFTCGLKTDGAVYCWGFGGVGQLGSGANRDRWMPAPVKGLSEGVTAIAAGYWHACALTGAGGVKCWGSNRYGQLGDGTRENRNKPVDVTGLSEPIEFIIAGGNHTCAQTESGTVMCWGFDSKIPKEIPWLMRGVKGVGLGKYFSCTLTSDRGMHCWGYGGIDVQGDGNPEEEIVAVDVGVRHGCVLTKGGAVRCFGDNSSYELGIGRTLKRSDELVDVAGLDAGVLSIAVGDFHSCAISLEGGVMCWGRNWLGQLGNGTDEEWAAPVDVIGFPSPTE